MLTFLFWNLCAKPLATTVASLANRHAVDVVVLAECRHKPTELLAELNHNNPLPFREPEPRSLCRRVVIYPRFPQQFLQLRAETAHYSCRHLRLPARKGLLLFALHLPSKLYRSNDSQSMSLPALSADIRQQEKAVGHERTLLVGDFNMNPYPTEPWEVTTSRYFCASPSSKKGKDMPEKIPNLWPADFGQAGTVPPVVILREQADNLTSMTNGVIEGRVSTTKDKHRFFHNLQLCVPSLDEYTFGLLHVVHGIPVYPADIVFEEGTVTIARSQEGFIQALRTILSSDGTKAVIRDLLAQVDISSEAATS